MRSKTKKIEPIKISSSMATRTKRVFSDDDVIENERETDTQNAEFDTLHDQQTIDGNDEPEVVRANDNSLMALRELHQNVSLLHSVHKKKIKKTRITSELRKSEITTEESSLGHLEKLDESIIDSISFVQDNDDDKDKDGNINANYTKRVHPVQHVKVIPKK